jgi:hypothetical protein
MCDGSGYQIEKDKGQVAIFFKRMHGNLFDYVERHGPMPVPDIHR